MQHYFTLFTTALWWNGALYGLYKACSLLFSLALYYTLAPEPFSLWVKLTSLVYLVLLWADFGLRKTIARYGLIWGKSYTWYTYIGGFQALVYVILLPFWYKGICLLVPPGYHMLYTCVVFAFFSVRGFAELIKAFYHASFAHKSFNIWNMVALFAEFLLSCFVCLFPIDPYITVALFFLIATCVHAILVCYASIQLAILYKLFQNNAHNNVVLENNTAHYTYRAVIKHAMSMWLISISKSLTERNFIIPLVSAISGTIQGNNFKITYDAALFVYRIGVRVIGSNDTVLLSVACMQNCTTLLQKTVAFIHKVYIKLLVVLLLFSLIIVLIKPALLAHVSLPLFLVIGISYTLEMFFLPYERYFEVKQHYIPLLVLHIMYLMSFFLVLYIYLNNSMSLLFFVMCVQLVRLIYACCLMVWYKTKYLIEI